MEKFRRFMYGRYGVDNLSFVTLIVGVILSFVGKWTNLWPILLVAYVIYIYALFRIFSRNIPARQKEMTAFLHLQNKVKGWFTFKKKQVAERGEYKYFSCPQCKQKLRAPKKRGKIEVTCQKCSNHFITKT